MLDIKAEDYNYELPDAKIASHPASPRDHSKLLIALNDNFVESQFCFIDQFLPSNSVIIFNETKVIPARLLMKKESGALIEFLLLDSMDDFDPQRALRAKSKCKWKCFVGNASKIKNKKIQLLLNINEEEITLLAQIVEDLGKEKLVEFSWNSDTIEFGRIIEEAGHIPLPPYIKRADEARDKHDYQAVFARNSGSVAAPTASLHFTDEVLVRLKEKNIIPVFLTLHVGAGTFQAVNSDAASHKMHCEKFSISKDSLDLLAMHSHKNWIVCGTTALRTLESILLSGHFAKPQSPFLKINQWDALHSGLSTRIDREAALSNLLQAMNQNKWGAFIGETSVFILPGVIVQSADYLITNFHQPQSTLLMLVDAFASCSWATAYQFALKNNYRFLSFGDACLFKNKNQAI